MLTTRYINSTLSKKKEKNALDKALELLLINKNTRETITII